MNTPLDEIPLKTVDGQASKLGAYAGKVRLVVNVASRCGLTPQYAGLEAVFEKFLVGRKGNVVERFAPDVLPDAEIVVAAIERERDGPAP